MRNLPTGEKCYFLFRSYRKESNFTAVTHRNCKPGLEACDMKDYINRERKNLTLPQMAYSMDCREHATKDYTNPEKLR